MHPVQSLHNKIPTSHNPVALPHFPQQRSNTLPRDFCAPCHCTHSNGQPRRRPSGPFRTQPQSQKIHKSEEFKTTLHRAQSRTAQHNPERHPWPTSPSTPHALPHPQYISQLLTFIQPAHASRSAAPATATATPAASASRAAASAVRSARAGRRRPRCMPRSQCSAR